MVDEWLICGGWLVFFLVVFAALAYCHSRRLENDLDRRPQNDVTPTTSTTNRPRAARGPSSRTKKCTGPCGQVLPLASFDIRRKSRDGHVTICKVCRRETRGPRGKAKREARELDKALGDLLAAGYRTPALVEILNRALTDVRQFASTGADYGDQVRAVRRAIEVHGCRLVEEITEDTGLSRWVVDRAILRLLAEGVIVPRDKFLLDGDADEPGRPPTEYHPADDPTGQDFTARLYDSADDSLL